MPVFPFGPLASVKADLPPPEEPKQSLLGRVGRGLVSFGTGIPQIDLDTQGAQNRNLTATARINEANAGIAEGEQGRQEELDVLAQASARGDVQATIELIGRDSQRAKGILESRGIDTEQKQEEAQRFIAGMRAATPEQQDALIRERIGKVAGRQGNPIDTASLLEMPPEERGQVLDVLEATIGSAKKANQPTQKSTPRVVQRPDGTQVIQTPTFNPNNNTVELIETPFEGEVLSSLGETAAERQAREIATAGGKEAAEQEAVTEAIPERSAVETAAKVKATDINSAVTAADALPTLNRAIDLLDSVDTGGFEAASLRAKQSLGIESADEAELSNAMGKAVLSQLRETFGAAFTAQEGEQLARIEANFSKSTAGNKRLLRQTKRLVDRVVKRGIDAAVANEDFATAARIKEASEFSLDFDQQSESPESEQQEAPRVIDFADLPQ